MKNGKGEVRRMLERVLKYELDAAAMYDDMIAKLKNGKIKERVTGLREAERRHAELVRKELKRFQ